MTTVESLLLWESQKLDRLVQESGDVAKLVNVFREFLVTVRDERQRFANERNVLSQQAKVADLNAEQRCSEMQHQIYELSNKLNQEAERSEELVKDGASATDELASLKKKIEELQAEKKEVSSKLQLVESDSTNFKIKLEDALRRLHYKEEEMKRLNSEWDTISTKERELSKLQAEARAKLSDVENREVSLKFREERLCQEKDIVTQQNTWLTDELTAKTNELAKLRQSSTERTCKLKSELAEKTEEATFLTSSHGTLKKHSTKLEKRVGELVNKLQDKDSGHLAEIENIRLQLNKQERLAELYSNNCDEYQSKIKDLTTAISEMQALLKQAQEEHISLEQHCTNQLNKHLAVTKELETKIASMQNELDNANDLILNTKKSGNTSTDSFDISQLSATAVTVGSMLKSGMTIVQMYSAYVESTEALALEKDKNRLQSQYLDQILKEIEEKAPLLQQQRADYENALLNQDNLSEKLEKSMVQVDHYRIACEESQNASRALKRENDRFKTQIKDLSQQLQVLMKEVEDARAGRVSRPHSRSQSPAINSSRVSSSSQVISDQLVSFRSIAELQQQNSKLLCVVRELSEEQERRETEDEDPKIVELRAKLESAGDQIKELKAAQHRQVEMVEAVARQRDMYRVLLAQAGHNMGPIEEKKEKSKEDEISKHELALSELQKEFTSYKTEKRDQIALVQDQLDGMRMEHSTMLAEKTRLSSKLEFGEEKYKIMENSYTTLSSETKQYKEKTTELSSTVLRLQLTNDRLQNESITTRDEVSKLRHSLEGHRKTAELLRVNEIKQRTQNEALVRESRTQNMLLSNLQTIHNNLERQEFERKERTDKKLDLLESELSEARRKLQSTELRYKTAEAIQNTQNRELKATLEKERKTIQERQDVLDKLQEQHNTLLTETAELKSQIETLQYTAAQSKQGGVVEDPDTPGTDRDVDETITAQAKRLKEQTVKITELQHKLIEMTAREESLKSQVNLAKQHAQQYKGISEAHELALNELSQSEQSVKTASEELISQNWQEITTLTDKVGVANEERLRLQTELEEYQTRGSNEIRELNGALTKTQHQLEESRQKEESAISHENDIRAQFSKLDVLFEESQTNLTEQRDRCDALEDKLTELTKQVTEYRQKLTETLDSKTNAERSLEEESRLWSSEKRTLEQDRDNLKERTDDLDQQNTLLHSQLATLSKDVVELQKAITTEQPITDSADPNSDKSTEELWEIIRYVRREKDILSTKMDVTDSEAVRYKNRCSFLEKQVEETRKCLDEERSKSDSSVMSLEQHQDMLKKVEEAQALAEKVKLVTEEKAKLTTMTSLLKQQIAAYEKQLKPLKSKQRELVDKVSILQTEKEGLKKDVSRWSNRTNELIEQCNKVDAKEFARLQAENNKLKIQLKKNRDEHTVEVSSLQEKQQKIEEESGRVSEEKRQLLGTINSMKADGTKIRIELNNVSAELKTSSVQVAQQRTELEKLKSVQQELAKELVDTRKQMEEQQKTDQTIKDNKDSIIQKLRTLAKKYKAQVQSQAEAQDANSGKKSEEARAEEQDKIKKAMDGMRAAKQKIDALTLRNKELETAVSESNCSTELLKSALEAEKADCVLKIEEVSAANATLQTRIQQAEEEVQSMAAALESKKVEVGVLSERLVERTHTTHAETNTDIIISRLDQQTNTEDTPTASVKPTTIIGLSTPTAAVRPTSMAPDITPRMATVTPTNTVHISTSSSPSSHLQPHISTSSSNTTTQVSSSSVQGQGESSSHEVTTGEVRAILRSSPRISSREVSSAAVRSQRDEVSSAAGIKRSRVEEDEEEQPGPSTKIAMVTSSAHVQHSSEQATSEVSQSSAPVFGLISQSSNRVESSPKHSTKHSAKHPSNKHPSNKHPMSVVSSTEHAMFSDVVASSSRPDNLMASSSRPDNLMSDRDSTADVTSSEAGATIERDVVAESNEATPAVRVVMETARVEGAEEEEEEEEEELMREQNTEADPSVPPVIEIASDSEGSSSGGMSNEEDVYSGFEEVEEDSRQLQFSFVQSSGTDPVMDILSEPDEQSLDLLDDANEEGCITTTTSTTDPTGASSSIRSLRSNDSPWAHLASSSPSDTTQAAPSSSSSSNVRSIRRIKRQPPKKE